MSIKDNKLLDVVINIMKRNNDLDMMLGGIWLEQVRDADIKKCQIEDFDRAKEVV